MKHIKKILLLLTAVVLVASTLLTTVSANTADDEAEAEKESQETGETSGKDEVIYATLSPTGEQQELYVVNRFDVVDEGTIVDYGDYTSVRNLTDMTEVALDGDKVEFTASDEEFYYQGNMEKTELPWSIGVTYYLDGEKISPEQLAGKEGQVKIEVDAKANGDHGSAFFNNYMLQVTLPFDSASFSNIQAPDGMVANAGKTQQVTFTLMPEKEKTFTVEANTTNFEFDGIEISGVPSSMSIEDPETDEMTGDIRTLSDAIADLNTGVSDLVVGVKEMNEGATELVSGSAQYRDGIAELDGSSGELVDGSKEIENALQSMNGSLSDVDVDTSQQDQLVEGLKQLSAGLSEMKDGLQKLKDNYSTAFQALDGAMNGIPSNITEEEQKQLEALNEMKAPQFTEEEIKALKEAGIEQKTLQKLQNVQSSMDQASSMIGKLATAYEKSQIAKGTYFGTEKEPGAKAALGAVVGSLEETISGLNEMTTNIDTMASEISSASDGMEGLQQLKDGIASLTKEYGSFHTGLAEYTNGVSELSNSYSNIHTGINEFDQGVSELEEGVVELKDGTQELHDSTKDMPQEMTEEIDEMISQYDKSDFDPVSFVSEKNEQVDHVQFVIQTKSIEVEEPEEEEPEKEEKSSFWEKFKALFS
ncbi:YhgE/Pip domain-containing protein [Allobacillus sp. SKP2-8]|uniref:YhgE/Pip domain-containing protein n=1 Tax=unclassified Allobacillus TaxID=2628859 RepID=UPI0011833971|nr:YhgE/Pip domain-containing protein [Allobacillus sp. SKP2-8]TSJ65774.1 YhgE/Pip domain-containing protein [Allobacillus sp. SKP2-8]